MESTLSHVLPGRYIRLTYPGEPLRQSRYGMRFGSCAFRERRISSTSSTVPLLYCHKHKDNKKKNILYLEGRNKSEKKNMEIFKKYEN